jgi:uncharacterized membrane protein
MLSLLLAATTALVWGTADFCGGNASRRAPALAVAVLSRTASLPLLALGLTFAGGTPSRAGLGWGALAGLAGMCGVMLLYRALSAGAMAVVAPVTAVTSALIPFLIGIAVDGAPAMAAMIGAACAIAAIALVSAGPSAGRKRISPAIVGIALAAGAGLGLFMTLLSRAGADTGLWPMAAAQLSGLGLGWLLLRRTRTTPWVTRPALRWAATAGALDFGANVAYLFAARDGALSVVAPIASLYPATTVLLALAVDRERIGLRQLAGFGLAAAALILVAL